MKSNKTTPAKHEIKQNNTHKNTTNKTTHKNMNSNKTTPEKHEIKQNNTCKT
jgi:hypothetical protein